MSQPAAQESDGTGQALSATEFGNLASAISAAFGDPTRRDIFLLVHSKASGLTAAQVAKETGLHANVARHHLDKLTAGGYLENTHTSSGGAGRPARVYRTTGDGLELPFGSASNVMGGGDGILVTLLGKALSRLPDAVATELAEEVGLEFGQQIASSMQEKSFEAALTVVADALSAHGFSAHTDQRGDELRIVSEHCPFGEVAIEHPVICAIERGMVKGLMASLHGEAKVDQTGSIAMGDASCVVGVLNTAR